MPEGYADKQRTLAKHQARMRQCPTPAEQAVKDALDALGVRYVFQKGFLRRKTVRIVDFYICRPKKLCIEVDGKYHETQADYDQYREGEIKRQRKTIEFLRITNEWVFEQPDLIAAMRDKLLAVGVLSNA